MKKKKVFMYIVIILIILFVLGIGYLIYINLTMEKTNIEISEFIPAEEITDEQLRMTNIELYFFNEEIGELEKEIRKIDARNLIENPAKVIIEELLKGPENKYLLKLIPENTKINDAKIDKGILYLDFSENFINDENLGKEKEELIINSIKRTMAQLLEINSIKILIDGQENMKFNDGEITFEKEFIIENMDILSDKIKKSMIEDIKDQERWRIWR